MGSVTFYTVKMIGCSEVHFATLALAETSLRISFHRHPDGPPRVFQKASSEWEVKHGPFTQMKYDRSRTDPESGKLIGTIKQQYFKIENEAHHL